jgi:hypothetical protein
MLGCSNHVSRGNGIRSPDGKTYLAVEEIDGPTCSVPTVDGKAWRFPLHTLGEISAGEHEIQCAAPVRFVVQPGTTYHFSYWGP